MDILEDDPNFAQEEEENAEDIYNNQLYQKEFLEDLLFNNYGP